MTETASFGNLVNALNSVRSDYHEHLKSIPQYEAFLLVETSTQRAIGALHGFVNSGAPSTAAEVISSLETATTKFKEHLTNVPEYRALLAIDKLVNDVSIDLGIQPASAQTALPTVEPGIPSHETTSAQPEADLAVSTSEHAVMPEPDYAESTSEHTAMPEASEITTTHQSAPPQPEPDYAVSASEDAVMQEISEITATHQSSPPQPEPDYDVSAAEHSVMPDVADIASTPPVTQGQPEVDLAVSLWDHTFKQLGIALTQSLTAAQIYPGAPLPKEDAGIGQQSEEIAPAPIEDLYVEPSAAPFDKGPEKAA